MKFQWSGSLGCDSSFTFEECVPVPMSTRSGSLLRSLCTAVLVKKDLSPAEAVNPSVTPSSSKSSFCRVSVATRRAVLRKVPKLGPVYLQVAN